jgi:hypothetical protein
MRPLVALVAVSLAWLVAAAGVTVDAHKPITSPYTFSDDVLPILRERCSACHVAGGPAPMPLTTAEETVPWGESIRLELVAGHMPPWAAMSGGARLRHAEGLTARELNVLLTWVTGGAPPGDTTPPSARATSTAWSLGAPDAIVPLPEVTLSADQGERTQELELPYDTHVPLFLRAVDVRPGTRSVVRSVRVSIRDNAADAAERVLALWVPGDTVVPLPPGAAFEVPAGSRLVARVRYKKTWEHEREVMSDRSEIGLYFATSPAAPVRAVTFAMPQTEPPPVTAGGRSGVAMGRSLAGAIRVVSVYPTAALAGCTVKLDAIPPGGPLRRLIEFSPRPGWERRYAFDTPIDLPAGTQLQLNVSFDPEGVNRPPAGADVLVLNVVPVPLR